MTKLERILTAAATLLLLLTLFFPLWSIDLWAPQYPEGLFMDIGLNKIEGNIDQINILNHYIGMKAITPASIPELQFMQYIIWGLIGLGALVSIVGRQRFAQIWVILLIVAALLGFYDYIKWGYTYGHELDPEAPIKVPGMTYQPPVIGKKTILNIDAVSYPHVGGIALTTGILLGLFAAFWRTLKRRREFWKPARAASAVFLLFSIACTPKPVAIQSGVDSCAYCRMQIADLRFGGEIISKKAKVNKFDSLGCLVRFHNENKDDMKAAFVLDYFEPGKLVEASKAKFLRSDKIQGPMGYGILASTSDVKINDLKKTNEGEVLDWEKVKSLNFSR